MDFRGHEHVGSVFIQVRAPCHPLARGYIDFRQPAICSGADARDPIHLHRRAPGTKATGGGEADRQPGICPSPGLGGPPCLDHKRPSQKAGKKMLCDLTLVA